MMANHVKGNKGLAEILGVSHVTVCNWKQEGILDEGIVSEFRRTIIYDIEKVFKCLNNRKARTGRPKRV